MAAYPVDHDFVSWSVDPFTPLLFEVFFWGSKNAACLYVFIQPHNSQQILIFLFAPQYKRLSAFQGDFIVGSARTTMLVAVSEVQGAFF